MSGSRDERKRAIDEFKNRKPRRGIFAARCSATGHSWVGSHPDLDAAKNGLWFTLRIGSHRNAALQQEWREHGEEAFTFEVLEELDEDVSPLLVNDLLKQKKAEWAAREGAQVLLR